MRSGMMPRNGRAGYNVRVLNTKKGRMQASHRRLKETPPEWCSQLVEVQQNASCRAPFTHIPATLAVPLTLSRDKYLRSVQRANRGLSDAHTSLGGSTASMPLPTDWWVWYNHARFLRRRGVYVDLATNDAIWRSNTYFFDACLGWGGLCIEASEVHYDRIKRERSCTLVPACVSNATNVSLTFSGGVGWRGGSSRLSAKPADPSAPLRSQDRRLRCRSLDDIFTSTTTKHVDVLSLDMQRMMLCNDSVDTCVENNVAQPSAAAVALRILLSRPGCPRLPQATPGCPRLHGASALGTNSLPVRLRWSAISSCFDHTVGGHVLLPHGLDRRRPAPVPASQLAVHLPYRQHGGGLGRAASRMMPNGKCFNSPVL